MSYSSLQKDQILLELESIIGADNIYIKPVDKLGYGVDYFWVPRMMVDRGRDVDLPDFVVKPETVEAGIRRL